MSAGTVREGHKVNYHPAQHCVCKTFSCQMPFALLKSKYMTTAIELQKF